MATGSGARLGPYVLGPALGAGGMGEVYRAHDSRLGRDVAIKILPPDVADDPERLRRFESEARAAAALNHPNILVVHDVGREHDTSYLVTELLEGRTLRGLIDGGSVPLPRAIDYAVQIAEGLAAAHARGIVHRDLKPENLFVTSDGRLKILDFGLAKAVHVADAATLGTPTHGTAPHVVLGTPGYMAPEQVRGEPVDHRADIFAFGCVLYELLGGRPAFGGATTLEILSAILRDTPRPLTELKPDLPRELARIVRRCLEKETDRRYQSILDVRNDLDDIRQEPSAGTPPRPGTWSQTARGPHPYWKTGVVLGALALAGSAIGVTPWFRPGPDAPSIVRLDLSVRPAENLYAGGVPGTIWPSTPGGSRTALAWSADGQTLVFVGRAGGVQQLYVRSLAGDARPLKGTERAQAPAVSPDGKWLAFWSPQALRRIPLAGGAVTEIASGVASPPVGLVWDDAGALFFGNHADRRIWRVSAEGVAEPVTTLGEAEMSHTLPWPLPGGRHLLYTVRKRWQTWGDEEIVVQTLATGERRTLLTNAADARYVPTGHLVFLRLGHLFAIAFDLDRLQVRGREETVLDESVAQALTPVLNQTGAGQFAIAPTGTLAFLAGPLLDYPDLDLVTIDRKGGITSLGAPQRPYNYYTRVSPDGRHLAIGLRKASEHAVWLHDLERNLSTLLMREGEAWYPKWSRDGEELVFRWLAGGRWSLAALRVDRTAPIRVLAEGELFPSSFAPNGDLLLVQDEDIVVMNLASTPPELRPVVATPAAEHGPEVSPDGQWLAYSSDESQPGRQEVYVRPYPGPGRAQRVSVDGGANPAWNPQGGELFFIKYGGPSSMMSVRFDGSPGRPQELFQFNPLEVSLWCVPVRCYDVAPDGQKFYGTRRPEAAVLPVTTHVQIVLNWFAELKARVPAR
jgi:eukaryotic-like serine/threonine-protein kinase